MLFTDDSGARRIVPDPVGLTMRLPTSRLMVDSQFVAGMYTIVPATMTSQAFLSNSTRD